MLNGQIRLPRDKAAPAALYHHPMIAMRSVSVSTVTPSSASSTATQLNRTTGRDPMAKAEKVVLSLRVTGGAPDT